MQKTSRNVSLVFALIFAATFLGSVVFSRTEKTKNPKQEIPKVFSKIPTIQIEGTRIIDENTEFARVEITVRNNSEKPVMAIDLVSGNRAVTKNGLNDPDNPIVVIEPYGTTNLVMAFGEMSPNSDLVIAAVTYKDGSEEGDAKSLDIMRRIRARDHAKIRAARRGVQPE